MIKKIKIKVLPLILVALMTPVLVHAGEGDEFFTVNAGYLYNNTLNANLGWEHEFSYDNAIEVFGEAGDRWEKDPVCGKVCRKSFWKKYYWDGGVMYKKSTRQWRNSSLRIGLGPVFGAYRGDFFYGVEGSFEWNYTFRSGLKFVIKQKNNVCFRKGDNFRNGLTVGFKIPL